MRARSERARRGEDVTWPPRGSAATIAQLAASLAATRYPVIVRPTIIDSDAGTDPDDTCVAIVVARHPVLFGARLMITNDETTRHAKARFVAHVMASPAGSAAAWRSIGARDVHRPACRA
jgi:hypothetical protein